MYTIENGFINKKNQRFDNIRNIHFAEKSDLFKGVGILVAETTYEDNPWIDDEFRLSNGIYLYQSYHDPKRALRIYKDFSDYPYLFHNDDKVVSELQKRQGQITNVEFPTGIVTLGDSIIGQEIPFYEKYQEIVVAFYKNAILESPVYYYYEIIKILKDLYAIGITYGDVHAKNFLIGPNDNVKIIDFEENYVAFDREKSYLYDSMINNLKSMLNLLSKIVEFPLTDGFYETKTLEEVEEAIDDSFVLYKKMK